MTSPVDVRIAELNIDEIAEAEGRVVVFSDEDGRLDQAGRRVNRLSRGALARYIASDAYAELKSGDAAALAWPAGLKARALHVVRLDRRARPAEMRKAGAAIGKLKGTDPVLVLAGNRRHTEELILGAMLRAYAFTDHKTKETPQSGALSLMVARPDELAPKLDGIRARVEGVFFTRDLTNEPANVLTTTEFAARLDALSALGVSVEVLEEDELEKLGMRALLGVGQGSRSPSKVVVMQWNGGGDEAPFAFVGKGVVFDTGGISLKPGAGMEDMTMDMGGAGVVAGVMKSLALRKAKANVVGLVGLVENMPDGNAQRPGDVVRTMKGDTVEIINTDAEGRMVLCDVLWYAQERFKPVGMIDLATLTGAIIVSLGHEYAGAFANSDPLWSDLSKACEAEGEGAWRMPLGGAYEKALKSDIADFKHVGGRWGGSITAACFLGRFVKDETPWIHLDIAGVASTKSDTPMAPKGASGWGVLALDRLIADRYET